MGLQQAARRDHLPSSVSRRALYLTLLAAYVVLRFQAFASVEPRRFRDTQGYMLAAERSLVRPEMWLGFRPFLVPLLYKVLGVDPRKAIVAQWGISVTAWAVLAMVTAREVRSPLLKPFVLASLLAFGSAGPIALWDGALLSESLALSLTALLVACGLRLGARWTFRGALLAAATGGALVFTRYVYAYLLFVLAGILAGGSLLARRHRTRWLIVAGMLAVVALAGGFLGQAGARWFFSSLNVLAQRLLPHDEARAYFVAHGMPVSPALTRLSGQWAWSEDRAFYTDPALADFRQWWTRHGKATYVRFLLGHPAYVLAGPTRDLEVLVSPELLRYVPDGWTGILGGRIDRLVYPGELRWVLAWLAAVLVLSLVAMASRGPEVVWLVPATLVLSSVPFGLMIWHADALEISRHVLPVGIHVRLGLLLMFWLATDRLVRQADVTPLHTGHGPGGTAGS